MTVPYYLNSIAREILLPPSSLFLLMACGLILARWRPRLGRSLSATAVALLFLLSTSAVARLFVAPLENFAPALKSANRAGAQAIVVLAAGQLWYAPEYGGEDIPDYIALARLRYAAKLQHETGLPVLVSGGGARDRKSYAAGMATALENEFRTPVRWREEESNTTEENAMFSAMVLRQEGVRRILLVTDAMHMRRSVMAFARTGLEVVPAPTVFFSTAPISPSQFLPSVEGLRRSYYALYQWIGIFWYWLRYDGGGMIFVPGFE